jgi:hypothetical protein
VRIILIASRKRTLPRKVYRAHHLSMPLPNAVPPTTFGVRLRAAVLPGDEHRSLVEPVPLALCNGGAMRPASIRQPLPLPLSSDALPAESS